VPALTKLHCDGRPPNSPPSSLANADERSTQPNRELLQSAKQARRHSAVARRTGNAMAVGPPPERGRALRYGA
jgi:hypothetical protein